MRLAWPCLVLSCLLAVSADARAQETEQERTALARSLFEEGVALGREGRWEQAVDRYRRVLVLRSTPQVKYNLAHALAQLGGVVEPAELCRQILRDASAPPAARADAQTLLAELEPRIARLTIRLAGEREGAEVTIDGAPLERVSIGVAMPIDPGTHEIAAVRGGEAVASQRVDVAPGSVSEITLDVPAPPPAPVEAVAPTEEEAAAASVDASLVATEADDGGGAWWPWALVGVAAVAGAVVAVVLLTSDGGGEELEGNLMPGRIEL